MFLQITSKYSSWDKTPEAYLWLTKISFELSSPNMGLLYAEQVKGDASLENSATEIANSYLAQLDIQTLQTLLEEGNNEEYLARLLVNKIVEMPYDERDNDYLSTLISQYDIDSVSLGLSVPEDVFKDRYKVAVLLPLFVDRLWQSGVYIQK